MTEAAEAAEIVAALEWKFASMFLRRSEPKWRLSIAEKSGSDDAMVFAHRSGLWTTYVRDANLEPITIPKGLFTFPSPYHRLLPSFELQSGDFINAVKCLEEVGEITAVMPFDDFYTGSDVMRISCLQQLLIERAMHGGGR